MKLLRRLRWFVIPSVCLISMPSASWGAAAASSQISVATSSPSPLPIPSLEEACAAEGVTCNDQGDAVTNFGYLSNECIQGCAENSDCEAQCSAPVGMANEADADAAAGGTPATTPAPVAPVGPKPILTWPAGWTCLMGYQFTMVYCYQLQGAPLYPGMPPGQPFLACALAAAANYAFCIAPKPTPTPTPTATPIVIKPTPTPTPTPTPILKPTPTPVVVATPVPTPIITVPFTCNQILAAANLACSQLPIANQPLCYAAAQLNWAYCNSFSTGPAAPH